MLGWALREAWANHTKADPAGQKHLMATGRGRYRDNEALTRHKRGGTGGATCDGVQAGVAAKPQPPETDSNGPDVENETGSQETSQDEPLLTAEEEEQLTVQREKQQKRLGQIRPYKSTVEAMNLDFTYRPLISRQPPLTETKSTDSKDSTQTSTQTVNDLSEKTSSWLQEEHFGRPKRTEQEIIDRKDNWAPANMIDYRNLHRFYKSVLGPEDGRKAADLVLSNPDREICRERAKRNVSPETFGDKIEYPGVSDLWRMLRDEDSSNDQIWTVYRELPSPGVSLLGEHSRGLLLHRFAKPRRRYRPDSLRYLALVDDMTEAGLQLSDALWNSAIFLAAKCSPTIRPMDLERSLGLWRRMEYQGHVRSARVTFNILFDIAIKAGQYKVAEKIVDEMVSRDLDFSRNGKVTKIYLQGQLKNPEGVRQEYNDFVRSGEVVDTVVLNCVMSSLMKAGEFEMAEKIYERMKDIHEYSKSGDNEGSTPKLYPSPSDNYIAYRRASERLGGILGATSYLKESLPDAHEALQAALPLTPDARTFHILLSHHAIRTGDFKRVVELLQDMKQTFDIPPQGMIFTFLFQGFATHGGVPGTEWTLKRLRKAWNAFIKAFDDPVNNTRAMLREQERTRKRISRLTWDLEAESGKLDETAAEKETARELARQDKATMDRLNKGIEPLNIDESSERTPPVTKPASAPASADEPLPMNVRNHLVLESPVTGDWRKENEVYMGRGVIIAVLNAFKKCGAADDLYDVWEAIDARWPMDEQRTQDVVVVKAELRRLLRGR
ncbi:mitochondrial ribosomal small subunit component [Ascosphaera pollenicola]|nr:mitochondrial ribosomal small subunit component [Ascosphaera pollenicola]